jgi:hypothetical protein
LNIEDQTPLPPVVLDFAHATTQITDDSGNILRTEVKLPLLKMFADLDAVVFIDAIEIKRGEL